MHLSPTLQTYNTLPISKAFGRVLDTELALQVVVMCTGPSDVIVLNISFSAYTVKVPSDKYSNVHAMLLELASFQV